MARGTSTFTRTFACGRTASWRIPCSLPRREEYAPAAAQLREIASVSPTLLDWMAEVPRLSAPLRDSVERGWLPQHFD